MRPAAVEVGLEVGEGRGAAEARRGELGRVEGDRPGQREHRDAGGPGPRRDPRRALAPQRLRVEAPLAGDDEVGPGEPVVEPEQLGDQVEARAQPRAEQGHDAEADAAGRPGAGLVLPARRGGRRPEHAGPGGEGGVEPGDGGRVGALLRAVDRGGAVRAEQRVVDVAGHLDDRALRRRRGR